MSERVPITIIGGGVIGCAIAYALSQSSDKAIFLIERNSKIAGCINCIGISSPGLTASLAIAEYVKKMVLAEGSYVEVKG